MTDDLIKAMARRVRGAHVPFTVDTTFGDLLGAEELEAVARAALAVVREREGWRTDMENAPRDVACIVALDGRVGEACFITGTDLNAWFWADDPERMPAPPTAWRALPPPPEAE